MFAVGSDRLLSLGNITYVKSSLDRHCVMQIARATMQALEKENQVLQLYLKQMEDARITDRQKALRQYLLTAQSMGMDFAASQV